MNDITFYHYYAQHFGENGTVTHRDGVLSANFPIQTSDDYSSMKKKLADDMKVDVERLVLCSISRLN